MEIKALHCSDLHLDTVFPLTDHMGDVKRREQKEILSAIVRHAAEEKVDILLLAGDIFDHTRVSPRTIEFLKDQLSSLHPVPVFISPGNCDPYMPDSPYACTRWPSNIVIFSSNRFKIHEIPGKNIIIYGAANKSERDDHGILKNFTPRQKEGIHIILFHGTYEDGGMDGKVPCFPFSRKDIEKCRANYCALGHSHTHMSLPVSETGSPASYPGAPDFMDFSDDTEKGVLLVTINEKEAKTRFLPTGKRRLLADRIDCTGVKDERELVQLVKDLAARLNMDSHMVKLVLEGAPCTPPDIRSLHEKMHDMFFHLTLADTTGGTPLIPDWIEKKTILADFFTKIYDLMGKEKSTVYKNSLWKSCYAAINALAPHKEN